MDDDGPQHPGVKVVGWLIIVVMSAAFGTYVWFSEGYHEPEEVREAVPIGGRCENLGAQERTYDGRVVFCVPFPDFGIRVWSWSDTALAAPVPMPVNTRQAQIRVCMHQARLDERNCAAGIDHYEGGTATR